MSVLNIVNCKLGKHKWEKAYVKDNKYQAWECPYCGARKFNADLSKIGKKEGEKK